MKIQSRFTGLVILACLSLPAFADNNAGQYVYLRSNANQPWGQTTNEDAMDDVFGAGNWTTMYYESLTGNSLFASSTKFIFMEGGDSSYTAFQSFMQSNGDSVYSWVRDGGHLLIMSAPNDPLVGATLSLPDNIVLNSDPFYESAASSADAVNEHHTIFRSPNSTGTSFTGDFFSHGYFTGNNVVSLMTSNLGEVVLGLDPINNGVMVFGGMTTDNFQLPQPAAHLFLENIITYTNSYGRDNSQ